MVSGFTAATTHQVRESFGSLAAEPCRRFNLFSYPHLKFFQPNVPWAHWEETRSQQWRLPVKSPQGHRYLRVGRHSMVRVPAICVEDTRLVPGLELLTYSQLIVYIVQVVCGIKVSCQASIFWENGSQH